MKIAFFENEPWEIKTLKKAFAKDKLTFVKGKLSTSSAKKVKDTQAISTFVKSDLSSKVLEQLPNLKLICTRSTGCDHIDLEYCREKKIVVCNVPAYGKNTVAEQAFALILNISRRIMECRKRTLKCDFNHNALRGFDLEGKTLGVVGAGNIGQYAIKIGKGFGMKVIAFDVYKNPKLAKKLGFKYATLDNVLKNSDIVTLHVPYNKHTHHLINRSKLKLMKNGSVLINTSRGAVVDTIALKDALKSKHLLAAGLDVLEFEHDITPKANLKKMPLEKRRVVKAGMDIMKMPNVLVTPHNAFNTSEAVQRILNTTIEHINGFKDGRVVNRVK